MKDTAQDLRLDFYSTMLLAIFSFLLLFHWQLFPLFMDIYYHLHTAWGFVQAGGYSGWDFWEFAPFGRPHIYPPLLHLVLAFFMKLGIPTIFLAKSCEIVLPIAFLVTVWQVMRSHFGKAAGLFTLVMCGSSFSFFLSLINHLPATLGLILGFLSLDQLFRKKIVRSALLLALCFYSHIGVSWSFALAFILFASFVKEYRRGALQIVAYALMVSLPILLQQLSAVHFITSADFKEKYLTEFKTIEYILAFIGMLLSWRLKGTFRIFCALFLSNLIYLRIPYRYFSAEGFLPVILLSSIALGQLYRKRKEGDRTARYLLPVLTGFLLVVSPTVLNTASSDGFAPSGRKVYYFDSSINGLIFPERNKRISSTTLWFPNEYLYDAALIKENSQPQDIIYCKFPYTGVCLASLSGRTSAVGLLPDIKPVNEFDPIHVSKIVVIAQNEDPVLLKDLISAYGLTKIGENKLFAIYRNLSCDTSATFKKSSVPFAVIALIAVLLIMVYITTTY